MSAKLINQDLMGLDPTKNFWLRLEIGSTIRLVLLNTNHLDVWIVDTGKHAGHQVEIWRNQTQNLPDTT